MTQIDFIIDTKMSVVCLSCLWSYFLTEPAPRPVQSISCDVRGSVGIVCPATTPPTFPAVPLILNRVKGRLLV